MLTPTPPNMEFSIIFFLNPSLSENGTKIVNGTGDFSDFLQIDQEDYEHCWNIIMLTSNKTSLMKIVNRKDNLGNTALHYATQKWNDKVVRDILELGANINATDSKL